MENPQSFSKKLQKRHCVYYKDSEQEKCVYYKVRESAGSCIKLRNIQVRGISKYEVKTT